MNILIATSGALPPAPVVGICDRLLHVRGSVTVMTVIEVPRTFLESMDEGERRSFLNADSWQTDTAEMKALSYLEERGARSVDPIVAALTTRAHETEVRLVDGSDPVEAIVSTALEIGADAIVMGATRRLFHQESWGSVSARVMERAHCPLILIPGTRAEEALPADRTEEIKR